MSHWSPKQIISMGFMFLLINVCCVSICVQGQEEVDTSETLNLVDVIKSLKTDYDIDAIKEARSIMYNMFDALMVTYKDRLELLSGVNKIAFSYRKVNTQSVNTVQTFLDTTSQFVRWLPRIKTLYQKGDKEMLTAVLEKLSQEIDKSLKEFGALVTAHSNIRDELEAQVKKANENREEAGKWKKILGVPRGRLSADSESTHQMITDEKYMCEDVYPQGVPDSVEEDENGLCVYTGHLRGIGDQMLSNVLVFPAIAFMTGTLSFSSSVLTGIGLGVGGQVTSLYVYHLQNLIRDFTRIRDTLKEVHDILQQPFKTIKTIHLRLQTLYNSNKFMQKISTNPNHDRTALLEVAIDDFVETLDLVKDSCKQYLENDIVPGTSTLKMLGNPMEKKSDQRQEL